MTYFTPEEITPRQSVIMFLKLAAYSMNKIKLGAINKTTTSQVIMN